jgi:hypothetical protein
MGRGAESGNSIVRDRIAKSQFIDREFRNFRENKERNNDERKETNSDRNEKTCGESWAAVVEYLGTSRDGQAAET